MTTTVAPEVERKGRPIARYLWRRGLTMADVRALPRASRRRTDLTRASLAREAFREAGLEGIRVPSDHRGGTWDDVARRLTAMERLAAAGDPRVPARDRLDDRDRWRTAGGFDVDADS